MARVSDADSVQAIEVAHTVDVPDIERKRSSSGLSANALKTLEDSEPLGCENFTTLQLPYVSVIRKVAAEIISTFILVFATCGANMMDAKTKGSLTHFGVAAASGIVVMMMIYAVGHISGAHMNPAVTLAFATFRHFPWKDVPLYIGAQIGAGIGAAFSLRLILGNVGDMGTTLPAGSNFQSLVVEIIATFILKFVVSAVATDTHAIGELAGLAVGSTVALNSLFLGPVSGASMNPARSIGPAVAAHDFRGVWVYIVGPVIGATLGAWGYSLIRGSAPSLVELEGLKTPKSLRHIP